MPIYEVFCEKCGVEFETITFKIDELPEECPNCKAPSMKLKRLMSRNGRHVTWSQWNAVSNNR